MRYFYVTFLYPGGYGSAVIPQVQAAPGVEGCEDINIAGAHAYLLEKLTVPAVVTWWKEVNQKRNDEFMLYCKNMHDKSCLARQGASSPFAVLQGGKAPGAESAPKGDLKPVPTIDGPKDIQ
jgi:hypothetical protein